MSNANYSDRRISDLENRLEQLPADLETQFVKGRLRLDRTFPASATDVYASDFEGDVVPSTTYVALLVRDGDVFKWARYAVTVSW